MIRTIQGGKRTLSPIAIVTLSWLLLSSLPTEGATPSSNPKSVSTLSAIGKTEGKAADAPQRRQTTAPHFPKASSPSPPLLIEPVELQPLSVYERRHQAVERESGNALTRLLIGLAGVLALFAGFARWLLPRLMERYPAFFEALRQRRHSPGKDNAAADLQATFSPSKTDLEEGEAPSPRLRVLTSTPLGTEQTLHLVDVSGRHLLIAAGASGAAVLKDVTDRPWPEEPGEKTAYSSVPVRRPSALGWETLSASGTLAEPVPEVVVLADYDDQF
jgi:flagellar biogenesis protein FliO